MHESLQGLYDVNTQGKSHSTPPSRNYSAGLPLDPFQAHAPRQAPFLHTLSSLFQPRSILRQQDAPIKSNDIFGDPISIPIASDITRMYFININGINLQKQAIQFRDLCTEIKHADIHLLAVAEHNLDTNKFAVRQLLQQTAHKAFPHHVIQTSTSTIPADKFYKPGGTMLLAQGDIVGRIKERGSDSMGRWSWLKLIGRNKRLITVISAYQVCTRPTNKRAFSDRRASSSLNHENTSTVT
jgi:hypothetical protein